MTFDYQPVLKGQLVELRPLHPGDFEDLYAVAADPLIWEQHPASDRCQRDVFQMFVDDALKSTGALIAIDAQTLQVIGSSRYHSYHEERSEVEIGWTFLARSHWGGRYNGEMKQLMLQHAFQFVENVVFLVALNNIRSQRAVEKIGGEQAGTRPDKYGNESYVYRITKSEFVKKNSGACC